MGGTSHANGSDMTLGRSMLLQVSTRLGLAAALFLASATASADAPVKRKVERFDVKTAGVGAGGARTIVEAPPMVVRSVVTDFGRYEEFITRFKSAKIVGRSGDKTDVYLQVPIMKGAVKIWAVVRFDPPKANGGDEIITGKMVKGNVKRLDATWRIKRLDDARTELTLELLIVPELPVPEGLRMSELRFAAFKAVSGTRDEAERRASGS